MAGKVRRLLNKSPRQRRRTCGVSQSGDDDVGHHDNRNFLRQQLENPQVFSQLFSRQLQPRKSEVGVDLDRAKAGKVFQATTNAPAPKTFGKCTGESLHILRSSSKTPFLAAQEGFGSLKINHRGQILVYSEVTARGARGLAQGQDSGRTGCGRLRHRRQFTPDGSETVDHAALEINGHERPGLQNAELPDQGTGLLPVDDIPGKKNDSGNGIFFENPEFFFSKNRMGNTNDQRKDAWRLHGHQTGPGDSLIGIFHLFFELRQKIECL